MAGTRNQVEGLPWYRAARAVGVGVDDDAMDQVDTSNLVDRARFVITEDPANAVYEYDQDSVAAADGFNVVAPTSNVGRFILLSVTDGAAFLTATDWYLDSVSGNDANDGATALTALKTQGELVRRLSGRVYAPVPTVTVHYAGSFPNETLTLGDVHFLGLTILLIKGAPLTQLDAGSVTAYTAFNPAGGTRAALTDATQEFTAFKQKRIRITSGAALTGVTRVCSLGGGATVANVGQFRTLPTAANFWTGANVNPGAGATYVVEEFVTVFQRYDFSLLGGNVQVLVTDIQITAPVPGAEVDPLVSYGGAAQGRNSIQFFGCDLVATFFMRLEGNATFFSCGFRGAGLTVLGNFRGTESGSCWFNASQLQEQAFLDGSYNIHDGDGARNVSRVLNESAYQTDLDHRGFFGNINGTFTSHVELYGNSHYDCQQAGSRLWGAAGNTVTTALKVQNGCGLVFVTKPTMTGAVAGNDVVLAGAAAIAWGAVPAIAAAPDNAYVNVKH